jgi:hypothetical protein
MPRDLSRGFVLAWTCSAAIAAAAQTPRPIEPVRPVPSRPAPPAAVDEEANAAVARALDHAVLEGWRDLRVEAECQTKEGFTAVEIFGNGIGIWKESAQFQLAPARLRALLEALRDGGFAGLRASYGGKGDPLLPTNQSPRVTCRIGLQLDGIRKHVAQLQGGRQSEALAKLANRILEECRAPAASGVGAIDLNDGLGKVAEGVLAPEAFHLVVHRSAQDSGGGQREGENWLLRVNGRHASVRGSSKDPARDAPLVLELRADDLGRLARQLVAAAASDLPGNLYADQYTDLTVTVLNRRKHVQARRFAGLTAATHGEKQKSFDRLLGQLEELRRRVSESGRPDAGSRPTP